MIILSLVVVIWTLIKIFRKPREVCLQYPLISTDSKINKKSWFDRFNQPTNVLFNVDDKGNLIDNLDFAKFVEHDKTLVKPI